VDYGGRGIVIATDRFRFAPYEFDFKVCTTSLIGETRESESFVAFTIGVFVSTLGGRVVRSSLPSII